MEDFGRNDSAERDAPFDECYGNFCAGYGVASAVDLLNGREHGCDVWGFGEQVCILQREQVCYLIVSKLDQEDFILSVSF